MSVDDIQEHVSEDDFKYLNGIGGASFERHSPEPADWVFDSELPECEYPDEIKCDGRLALITAYYGGKDDVRRKAHMRALAEWDRQSVKPDEAVFMEMVLPGEEPAFSRNDMPSWISYFRIYGKERNRNLFQKEALWNLATKLTSAGKLFFLDGDCMPVGCDDYFGRMRDACVLGSCVHAAWHVKHEGQPPEYSDYYSCFADKSLLPENAKTCPGFGYCLTRNDFMKMDGFNPWEIFGSGDCLFLWENLPSNACTPMKFGKRMHSSLIRRGRPKLNPVAVRGLTIQHNFHRLKVDNVYQYGNYLIELFGSPKSYCHIDSAGLVAWNDQEFILKRMLSERMRMHSREELYGLVCDVFRERIDNMMVKDKSYEFDRKEWNAYD